MAEIIFAKSFAKDLKKLLKRSPSLKSRIKKRIDLFSENPFHNSLHSHNLFGKMRDFLSFSITGDIRVIYYWKDGKAILIAIGTHDEVYG